MVEFKIPMELVEMLTEGRVIPFIGAGFSAPLGLPAWEEMLARIAPDIDDSIPFATISQYCQGDLLQIAEYLYLKCDKSIGPLRHKMSQELQPKLNPAFSSSHVELVNLGAPQIYTTNYDNLIELTFKELGLNPDVVALPKHVALSGNRKPQVVKFHGDLRYDNTLVLTESSYYTRLDFESPMDLKFRSDLLGRSVLFMGYSFRDVNIRVIWFKLMQMMQDIPAADRPLSYVVRFETNPVLDTLYEAVGIKTIVLDPNGAAKTPEEKQQLFGSFMLELALRASPEGRIPNQQKSMFASPELIRQIHTDVLVMAKTDRRRLGRAVSSARLDYLLEHFSHRNVFAKVIPQASQMLADAARNHLSGSLANAAIAFAKQAGASVGVTLAIARGLTYEGGRLAIENASNVPWGAIWAKVLSDADTKTLFGKCETEIEFHGGRGFDEDLAYCVDVLARMVSGEILLPAATEAKAKAQALLEKAAEFYPSVSTYKPAAGTEPKLDGLIAEMREVQERIKQDEPADADNDIPF